MEKKDNNKRQNLNYELLPYQLANSAIGVRPEVESMEHLFGVHRRIYLIVIYLYYLFSFLFRAFSPRLNGTKTRC